MEIRNAVIESAKLVVDERSFLSLELQLDYGKMRQKFDCGRPVYLSKACKFHTIRSLAGHFIWRIRSVRK